MAIFRTTLRAGIAQRLGDTANAVFPVGELNLYIDEAIKSLYPSHFLWQTATTTAGAGPLQTMPAGAKDLYYIGIQSPTSTRVRLVRQWREGNGSSFVPKTGITGYTIVWAWTGEIPTLSDDVTAFTGGNDCVSIVILRSCIACLERIVSSRVEIAKYFALTVREGVTETDLVNTIDAYHASLDTLLKAAVPRPARLG